MPEVEMSDRRSIGLKEIVLVLTLLLNFGGLVWGAATMSASISQLNATVRSLQMTTERVVNDLSTIKVEYNARLRVLEDRGSRERD